MRAGSTAFRGGNGWCGDDKSDGCCDADRCAGLVYFGVVTEPQPRLIVEKAESWTENTGLDMRGANWRFAFSRPCSFLVMPWHRMPIQTGTVFEMAAAQPIESMLPLTPAKPVQAVQLIQPVQPAPDPTLPAPPQQTRPAADAKSTPPDQKFGEQPPDRSHEILAEAGCLAALRGVAVRRGLPVPDLYSRLYATLASRKPDLGRRFAQDAAADDCPVRCARYGISDSLQAFADVPFGWSNTEISYPGFDDFTNQGGIGDMTVGLNWLVHKSCGCSCDPDVVATFSFTAPTANVNPLQGILEPPNTLLGTGFLYGYWNVLFIHTVDPVILFYGFGSRHGFSREFEGFDIHPGDQYYYRAGLGFAVNEKLTLSSSLTGWYITDPYVNGVRIAGLAMEPVTLRFAATIARPCERYIEPFVELGLTPDAPDVRIGLTFTF